jgi:hypothetical protein
MIVRWGKMAAQLIPNHGVEGSDCYGKGRVKEGPTCCTGKSYWGAVKKACDVDQYEAPPMGRSKEDGQAGYTGKSYRGAMKKACDIDQYGTLPMDGSKDGQARCLRGRQRQRQRPRARRRPRRGQRGCASRLRGREGQQESGQQWCLRGTNGGCSGQGASGARSVASGGAHVNCDKGRAGKRVATRSGGGACGGACRGASDCDGTHGALTGGWRLGWSSNRTHRGRVPHRAPTTPKVQPRAEVVGPDRRWVLTSEIYVGATQPNQI